MKFRVLSFQESGVINCVGNRIAYGTLLNSIDDAANAFASVGIGQRNVVVEIAALFPDGFYIC